MQRKKSHNGLSIAGFHVDDSEVTLNVCLGKEFDGGELFFRGVRCDKHVNGESRPEVCSALPPSLPFDSLREFAN